MVRFELILTRLPSVPAHEFTQKLNGLPPELNRGILANAMWAGRVPDVAIGWCERPEPLRAALAQLVALGAAGYVEDRRTGLSAILYALRKWMTAPRKPSPRKPRAATARVAPQSAVDSPPPVAVLSSVKLLVRPLRATGAVLVLYVASAILYLAWFDRGALRAPAGRLAARAPELIALFVGVIASQLCGYALRRSIGHGSQAWQARALALILVATAMLAAGVSPPPARRSSTALLAGGGADVSTPRTRDRSDATGVGDAGQALEGEGEYPLARSDRERRRPRARSASPDGASTDQDASGRAFGLFIHSPVPTTERELRALLLDVTRQMAGPAPDPPRLGVAPLTRTPR